MARILRQERNTTILRILQLLSQIYPWIYMSCQTTNRVNRKKRVEMVRRREECL